jgi:Ribbon-helix-helix protein, copG family
LGLKKTVEEKPRPRTEAEYLAKSAENISRGAKKVGRPAGPDPTKNITVSLPVSLIEALDELAADRTARNRSYALVEVLNGRLKLPLK